MVKKTELYYTILADAFREKLIDYAEDEFIAWTENETKAAVTFLESKEEMNEINMAKLNEITIRTEIKTSEEGRSIDKVLMLERFKKALKALEIWYDFEGQPINLDD